MGSLSEVTGWARESFHQAKRATASTDIWHVLTRICMIDPVSISGIGASHD